MKPVKIVIEMDGGFVQGVYSDTPVDFVIVNLERLADDTAVSDGSAEPLRRMPEQIKELSKMGPKDWSPYSG